MPCLIVLLLGCNSSNSEQSIINSDKKENPKEELVMAKVSEMSLLMNEMYAYNEAIKQQIIVDKFKANYPERFDKIHTAVLTDPTDRDNNFERFSMQYIESQKAVYNGSEDNLKSRYNNAINMCITCHNVKCVGPIPRIKKLLIH